MTDYTNFLASKRADVQLSGFDVAADDINPKLYPFQRDIVRWALKLGKAALFEECGLGKTFQQLEWAKHVSLHTGRNVLILAPLAVAHQTVSEGAKLGIEVTYAHDQSAVISDHNIYITNYERLEKFNPDDFGGVVLDESSILKAYTGKTKRAIFEAFRHTPYKLACTATPAPNDHLELGNHAEFLDIMVSNEMISRWFVNDTMAAGVYRLKKHAAKDFWRWLTSWAVCISKPRDLGAQYDMPGFDLPELQIHEHTVATSQISIERAFAEGTLLPDSRPSSTELHRVKRESLSLRVEKAQQIVSALADDEPVILWCESNDEADALKAAFPNAVEVRGSHTLQQKEERLSAFSDGNERIIITKPSIAGFGMNWQHCAEPIFVGLSYSFEMMYQALHRTHRYGQARPVNAHFIYSGTEYGVMEALRAKESAFTEMQQEMSAAVQEHGLFRDDARRGLTIAASEQSNGNGWTVHLGDCVQVAKAMETNSVDFGVHSPPFANLYIYSDSEADMGNSADDAEFLTHYGYLVEELYRVTKPGRLHAVHCKDLPNYMNRDGSAGLRDFPGDIIRLFESHGWQYHSRVVIWKDPVIEMQRTKNHGLLHKNFVERSEACRQGMPDYMVVFRKWPLEGGVEVKQQRVIGDYVGTNPPSENDIRPGKRTREENYSIAVWQRYASPVWMDIDQTNVLNYRLARANDDERHICPLQLGVIERSIDLWSNPGDLVFDPFTGIGSTGVVALKKRRRFVGAELKPSYHKIATRYLQDAEDSLAQPTFFDLPEPVEA